MGLEPEAHYEASLEFARTGVFPMDDTLAVDTDIRSAAAYMVTAGKLLPTYRKEWFRSLVELARAVAPLTEQLLSYQHPEVAAVAKRINVGFLAAAVVLCAWPDVRLPYRYLSGFRCLGELERTGVLREVAEAPMMSRSELMAQAEDVVAKAEQPPRAAKEDVDFLRDECLKDYSRGFAGPLLTKQEADEAYGPGSWVPMPRFMHVQPNGKRRPIDDGKRHSHNKAMMYTETLDCVTAIQPAVHLKAFCAEVREHSKVAPSAPFSEALASVGFPGGELGSGTEDMPDAYRYVPAHPEEAPFNVVSVWNSAKGRAEYQTVFGHVFGRSAAVVNFHRLQRLVNALGRRWLQLLMSFYYDDVSVQDMDVAGLIGQRHLRGMMELIGLPLSPKKSKDLAPEADYLGLIHSVAKAMEMGEVIFRPRTALSAKLRAMVEKAIDKGTLTPEEASKLRGVVGFLATGCYGQVGRGGAQPLIRRQYADAPPYRLHAALKRALQYYVELQDLPLARRVRIWGAQRPPVVIATDGRVDDSAPASVAYVAHDLHTGVKRAGYAVVPDAVVQEWGGEQGIALVEETAVLLTLQEEGARWQDRDVVWFVDNTVVVAAMCKGSSQSLAIDEGATMLHLVVAKYRWRIWWEYIESKSNWADRLSRDLADPWLDSMGYSCRRCQMGTWPWRADDLTRWQRVCAVEAALG